MQGSDHEMWLLGEPGLERSRRLRMGSTPVLGRVVTVVCNGPCNVRGSRDFLQFLCHRMFSAIMHAAWEVNVSLRQS